MQANAASQIVEHNANRAKLIVPICRRNFGVNSMFISPLCSSGVFDSAILEKKKSLFSLNRPNAHSITFSAENKITQQVLNSCCVFRTLQIGFQLDYPVNCANIKLRYWASIRSRYLRLCALRSGSCFNLEFNFRKHNQ